MPKQTLILFTSYLAFCFLAGFLAVGFAFVPQLDLWRSRGTEYKGVYAVIDHDEPFYAAYIQSQIDGKPVRNSPFSGSVESLELPQHDSYLSIQFLSTYPVAVVARLFGSSISTTMMGLLFVCAIFSTIVVFHLFFLLTEDPFESFVGTIAVLFLGAVAGGQGGLISYFFEGNVQYSNPLLFLRRTSPAISFPVLFFFFFCVWKFLFDDDRGRKILFTLLASGSFAFLVYSYFYHWTTALGWLVALILLLGVFRTDVLKKNRIYIVLFTVGSLVPAIAYAQQVINRSTYVDSVLFLELTRQPDMFRISELLSYASIIILAVGKAKGLVDLRDLKILFILSLALIAPIVFNQQVITGRSLQSFHYELFCANYTSVFALVMARLVVLKRLITVTAWRKTLLHSAIAIALFASFDSFFGLTKTRGINLTRDQLLPIAEEIKQLNKAGGDSVQSDQVLLAFDFAITAYLTSNDFPSLASQPVLWSPHIALFPDVDSKTNRDRLFKSFYYQGFDKARLRAELRENADSLVPFAVFGGERISKLYTGRIKEISTAEIEQTIDEFDQFRRRFDLKMAGEPRLAYVLVNQETEGLDLSFVDRWYERDGGREFGKFKLYRVKLRDSR